MGRRVSEFPTWLRAVHYLGPSRPGRPRLMFPRKGINGVCKSILKQLRGPRPVHLPLPDSLTGWDQFRERSGELHASASRL